MLKSLNLNYIGYPTDAGNILDTLIKKYKPSSDDLLPCLLTRAMIHFQQGELSEVRLILSKFQRTDHWYEHHVGLDWVLNKNFIEILLHIDLDDIDFVESRITSFKRSYGKYFKENKRSQAIEFLNLVKSFYHSSSSNQKVHFIKKMNDTLEYRPAEQEDIFLMSYYAWLKSKIENTNLYETTINLVNSGKKKV